MIPAGASRLEEFIAKCGDVSRPEDLWTEAQAFFAAFGAERSIYLHLPPLGTEDEDNVEVFARGCEPERTRRYRARRLYRQDPVISGALRRADPTLWSEVHRLKSDSDAQRAVLGFYQETGFTSGLAVPVFGPGGRNGIVTIGFGQTAGRTFVGINSGDARPACLQAACQTAHLRHCLLRRPPETAPPKLSERERELLGWVARGKSNGVIAQIMQISPHTVDAYMRRVFLKLGATDRISAAMRALGEGLVIGY